VSRPREARRQGSAPGCSDALQATRAEFNSPALHSSNWAAIWDRAGLQIRPARFNPSAARHAESATERSVTGLEHRGDLTVRSSIPPLSSDDSVSEWSGCGLQHRTRRFDSDRSLCTVVRAARTRSSKPVRRVRLSHGAQTKGGLGVSLVSRSSTESGRFLTCRLEIQILPGASRSTSQRAPRPRACPSSIAGDAAVL
jgi:hypothetical protein